MSDYNGKIGMPWAGYYLTAYGIAVKHGFVGTEEEWLESLKGDKGDVSITKGHYDTLPELESAHPTGSDGDIYMVGDHLYYWDMVSGAWEDAGSWQGPKGDKGTGLDIKGTYESLEALRQAVQSPQQGDMYNVGAVAPFTIYMWDDGENDWISQGQLQGPKGDTGAQGPAGAAAGFGTPSATVDNGSGTPSVEISSSGPDTAKVFSFAFHNLKGEKGDTGAQGPAGADGVQGPAGADGAQGPAGQDGGYYSPAVDASGNLSWTASKSGMPAAPGANIRGPAGIGLPAVTAEDNGKFARVVDGAWAADAVPTAEEASF